jgi:hypothetical protein
MWPTIHKRQSRNLIIACVGDNSTHRSWISGRANDDFDLMLIEYGSGLKGYERDCQFYLRSCGTKYPLTMRAFQQYRKQIREYENIWLPDDDIGEINSDGIRKLFAEFEQSGLQLAQPAVRHHGTSYEALWPIKNARWHNTNFVEIMCPLFTRRAFERLVFTFRSSVSGWGLDFWWSVLLRPGNLGVIDTVPVTHTRQCNFNSPLYKSLAKLGINPTDELYSILHRAGMDWFVPTVIQVH